MTQLESDCGVRVEEEGEAGISTTVDGGSGAMAENSTSEERRTQSLDVVRLLAYYQEKVRNGKRAIARLRRQKDSQLETITHQLLLLEAQLRREQKEILGHLTQRDTVIILQQQEIEKLRRDNRRLISRLKKITEGRGDRNDHLPFNHADGREIKNCALGASTFNACDNSHGYLDSQHLQLTQLKSGIIIDSANPLVVGGSSEKVGLPSHAELHELSRQTSNCDGPASVFSVRAPVNRILHKPPIAEKPQLLGRSLKKGIIRVLPPQKGFGSQQCNIVSTISRLLDEESDATTTGGSGSSEPSSPEATLKAPTPRVIRLARQFEEGLPSQRSSLASSATSDTSDSARNDDQNLKILTMDEYEVTSGYNSDAVSEHDYENVTLGHQEGGDHSPEAVNKIHVQEDSNQDSDDNYVILSTVRRDNVAKLLDDSDDHIYCNVEFSGCQDVDSSDPSTITDNQDERNDGTFETPSGNLLHSTSNLITPKMEQMNRSLTSPDNSYCYTERISEHPRPSMNVPRSRHNINFIIDTKSDHMTENFEEFTLDALELGDDQDSAKEITRSLEKRHCGDGAETKAAVSPQEEGVNSQSNISGFPSPGMNFSPLSTGQYEKFLEATGLSQKSILTPSRMFSNHRSVLKPRDIKHRDKLRAAFITLSTLEEVPTSSESSSSSMHYWTEPYL